MLGEIAKRGIESWTSPDPIMRCAIVTVNVPPIQRMQLKDWMWKKSPVPVHPLLPDALSEWRKQCAYTKPDDWVFASRRYRGRMPYWVQAILRKHVRPVAQRVGIQKCSGWHTFRHTYSTLLRSVGTEFKVIQELLRHSSLRSTLDIYTQAITPAKHAAQATVLSLVFSPEANGASQSSSSGDVAA